MAFKGSNENFQQPKIEELMSFENEPKLLTNSSSNPNFPTQSTSVSRRRKISSRPRNPFLQSLFNENAFDPLHFSAVSTSSSNSLSKTRPNFILNSTFLVVMLQMETIRLPSMLQRQHRSRCPNQRFTSIRSN